MEKTKITEKYETFNKIIEYGWANISSDKDYADQLVHYFSSEEFDTEELKSLIFKNNRNALLSIVGILKNSTYDQYKEEERNIYIELFKNDDEEAENIYNLIRLKSKINRKLIPDDQKTWIFNIAKLVLSFPEIGAVRRIIVDYFLGDRGLTFLDKKETLKKVKELDTEIIKEILSFDKEYFFEFLTISHLFINDFIGQIIRNIAKNADKNELNSLKEYLDYSKDILSLQNDLSDGSNTLDQETYDTYFKNYEFEKIKNQMILINPNFLEEEKKDIIKTTSNKNDTLKEFVSNVVSNFASGFYTLEQALVLIQEAIASQSNGEGVIRYSRYKIALNELIQSKDRGYYAGFDEEIVEPFINNQQRQLDYSDKRYSNFIYSIMSGNITRKDGTTKEKEILNSLFSDLIEDISFISANIDRTAQENIAKLGITRLFKKISDDNTEPFNIRKAFIKNISNIVLDFYSSHNSKAGSEAITTNQFDSFIRYWNGFTKTKNKKELDLIKLLETHKKDLNLSLTDIVKVKFFFSSKILLDSITCVSVDGQYYSKLAIDSIIARKALSFYNLLHIINGKINMKTHSFELDEFSRIHIVNDTVYQISFIYDNLLTIFTDENYGIFDNNTIFNSKVVSNIFGNSYYNDYLNVDILSPFHYYAIISQMYKLYEYHYGKISGIEKKVLVNILNPNKNKYILTNPIDVVIPDEWKSGKFRDEIPLVIPNNAVNKKNTVFLDLVYIPLLNRVYNYGKNIFEFSDKFKDNTFIPFFNTAGFYKQYYYKGSEADDYIESRLAIEKDYTSVINSLKTNNANEDLNSDIFNYLKDSISSLYENKTEQIDNWFNSLNINSDRTGAYYKYKIFNRFLIGLKSEKENLDPTLAVTRDTTNYSYYIDQNIISEISQSKHIQERIQLYKDNMAELNSIGYSDTQEDYKNKLTSQCREIIFKEPAETFIDQLYSYLK